MEIRSSPHIMTPRGQANKNTPRVFMLHNSLIQPNRTATVLIKSCTVNKVFEDQVMGIVCYRDEKGEVICEGYDEGPRFCHHESLRELRNLRIPDFSQQRRIKIFGDADVLCVNGIAAVQDQDKH